MVFPIVGGDGKPTGYEISNSARFDQASSAYLTRTPSSAGNRKTWTWSGWVKNCFATGETTLIRSWADDNNFNGLTIDTNGQLSYISRTSGSNDFYLNTTPLFKDPSAWYHFVVASDTTQGTASNRVKFYVNGTQITTFDSDTYPNQQFEGRINNDTVQSINRAQETGGSGTKYGHCYMADVNFLDGLAYDPTYFGETDTNGVWIPKEYDGSYGTNGFFLEFQQTGTSANSSGIGADTSGNDHHFTVGNMTAIDITPDTPTNNFATMDPNTAGSAQPVLREGNTEQHSHGTANSAAVASTIMPDAGKWYVELKLSSPSSGDYPFFGITDNINLSQQDGSSVGDNGSKMAAGFEIDGQTNNQSTTLLGTITNTNTGWPSFSDNDIVQFALDLDNRKLWIGRNGTYINSGDPAGGSNQQISWTLSTQVSVCMLGYDGSGGGGAGSLWHFGIPAFSISSSNADANGHGNFEYAVPSGYFALCSKNLAEIS